VCGEAVIDINQLPEDIRKLVYKPKSGETYNIETKFDTPTGNNEAIAKANADAELDIDISDEPDTE